VFITFSAVFEVFALEKYSEDVEGCNPVKINVARGEHEQNERKK
jgi:hypothetical protein